MKIVKIEVKELFGIFNHTIPLNTGNDERITIIHGPNGYGKTVLLTLVNAFFKSQYNKLTEVPFNSLILHFDDNSNLSILQSFDSGETKHQTEGKRKASLKFRFLKPGATCSSYTHTGKEVKLPTNKDEPELTFVAPPPTWVQTISTSIPIHLIETQRLLNILYDRSQPTDRRGKAKSEMTATVLKDSEHLVRIIQDKLADYATLSQGLDRSFPSRLLKTKTSTSLSITEMTNELKELDSERNRLIAAGLLEQATDLDTQEMENIDEANIRALSVYITDVREKLNVFNGLTDKIDLLLSIINQRFLYKQLSIDKREGFIFHTTTTEERIPLTALSSGEQHELVLIYQLLFKVKPDTLIMIDEPELSLHVAWQQQFISDLQKITQLAGFDVLLATHSPQIIHDRWDLTVELKGPDA